MKNESKMKNVWIKKNLMLETKRGNKKSKFKNEDSVNGCNY